MKEVHIDTFVKSSFLLDALERLGDNLEVDADRYLT